MAGKDVAKQGQSGMTLEEMTAELAVRSEVQLSDPKAVQEQILAKILAADSVEGVFENVGTLTKSDTLIGIPIEVLSVKYNKSDIADSPLGFYAVIEYANLKTGEKDNAGVGSTTVMAQLFRLDMLNAFPIKVVLSQTSKPTAQGYYPQYLQQFSD